LDEEIEDDVVSSYEFGSDVEVGMGFGEERVALVRAGESVSEGREQGEACVDEMEGGQVLEEPEGIEGLALREEREKNANDSA